MATFIPNPGANDAAKVEVSPDIQRRADNVAESARTIVPVLTGALLASIEVVQADEEGGWRVEATAPYAGFVEFGTSDTPAQPYLGPSLSRAAE